MHDGASRGQRNYYLTPPAFPRNLPYHETITHPSSQIVAYCTRFFQLRRWARHLTSQELGLAFAVHSSP